MKICSTAILSGYSRLQGVGYLSAADAVALGVTGPPLRASGVDWDLRRDMPYSSYEKFQFKVPVSTVGDVWTRYTLARAGNARVGQDLPAGAGRHARGARSKPTRPRWCCRTGKR